MPPHAPAKLIYNAAQDSLNLQSIHLYYMCFQGRIDMLLLIFSFILLFTELLLFTQYSSHIHFTYLHSMCKTDSRTVTIQCPQTTLGVIKLAKDPQIDPSKGT